MSLKPGLLVRNVEPTLFRMAIITRVWQNKPAFSQQVEVVWTHYPSRPEMVGRTTQMDSRRFRCQRYPNASGYVIVQDEHGQPSGPLT